MGQGNPPSDRLFRLADRLEAFVKDVSGHFSTGAAVYWVLVTTCGSIPWLSLVKKFIEQAMHLSIQLPRFPDVLLYGYELARDAGLKWLRTHVGFFADLFPEVLAGWIRATFDLVFSGVGGDITTLWVLFAFAIFRGSAVNRAKDKKRFERDPEAFRAGLRSAALLHGLDANDLIARVESSLGDDTKSRLIFLRRSLRSAISNHRVLWRNLKQLRQKTADEDARTLLTEWGLSVGYALFGVLIYLSMSGFSHHTLSR